MGGLGNQLFIYAAALAYSRRLSADLSIDKISGFARDFTYRREYLLHQFNMTATEASWLDCFPGRMGRAREIVLKLLVKHIDWPSVLFVDEKAGLRLTDVGTAKVKKFYLRGYWQSEKYFSDWADAVRQEFTVKMDLPEDTIAEHRLIQRYPQPVAVGLRRFDEVPTNVRGDVIGMDFYHAAIEQLGQRIADAHFFVFTEDVSWAQSNMKIKVPHTFIKHKPGNERAYEDLILMRSCRHFIIGNSSYHWWGTWLAPEKDKVVMVPQSFAVTHPDFYPSTWLRL